MVFSLALAGGDCLQKGVGEWKATLPLPLDGIGWRPRFWQTLASHWQCSGTNAFWQANTLLLVSRWLSASLFLPFFLLLFLTVHRVMVAQKQDGDCQTGHRWLLVWTVHGFCFPNTMSSAWFINFTVQSKFLRFFGLWTYPPAVDYRISPSQAVSLCRSMSVQSVGCQLFCTAMKNVREGLCNVSGAVRTNWY